jgi:hypothetical protein
MEYKIQSVVANLGETAGGLYCALKDAKFQVSSFDGTNLLTMAGGRFRIHGEGVEITGKIEDAEGRLTLSGDVAVVGSLDARLIINAIEGFCLRGQ